MELRYEFDIGKKAIIYYGELWSNNLSHLIAFNSKHVKEYFEENFRRKIEEKFERNFQGKIKTFWRTVEELLNKVKEIFKENWRNFVAQFY